VTTSVTSIAICVFRMILLFLFGCGNYLSFISLFFFVFFFNKWLLRSNEFAGYAEDLLFSKLKITFNIILIKRSTNYKLNQDYGVIINYPFMIIAIIAAGSTSRVAA
jgi:hypothetical protein